MRDLIEDMTMEEAVERYGSELSICHACNGTGMVDVEEYDEDTDSYISVGEEECWACGGKGEY